MEIVQTLLYVLQLHFIRKYLDQMNGPNGLTERVKQEEDLLEEINRSVLRSASNLPLAGWQIITKKTPPLCRFSRSAHHNRCLYHRDGVERVQHGATGMMRGIVTSWTKM